jgi:hypothetical protein
MIANVTVESYYTAAYSLKIYSYMLFVKKKILANSCCTFMYVGCLVICGVTFQGKISYTQQQIIYVFILCNVPYS